MVLKKPYINLLSIFFYLCMAQTCTLKSYVYEAQTLYNPQLDQKIILLSDYHEDSTASTEQRLAILDKAKKDDACLLVEDQAFLFQHLSEKEIIAYQPCLQPIIDDLIDNPLTFDPNKRYAQDFSIIDPETEGDNTPLYLLTHMARNMDIKAYTIECRQAEVISHKGGPITASCVCQVYDKEVACRKKYNDGPIYNAFYQDKINSYQTYSSLAQKFFSYLRSSNKNLMQAYKNRSFEQVALKSYAQIQKDKPSSDDIAPDEDVYDKLISSLYLWLIDTEIIHQIAQHPTTAEIIVYAGGAHIDEIIPILHAQGYNPLAQSGQDYETAVDLNSYFEQSETLFLPNLTQKSYTQSSLLCALATPEDPLTTTLYKNLL